MKENWPLHRKFGVLQDGTASKPFEEWQEAFTSTAEIVPLVSNKRTLIGLSWNQKNIKDLCSKTDTAKCFIIKAFLSLTNWIILFIQKAVTLHKPSVTQSH